MNEEKHEEKPPKSIRIATLISIAIIVVLLGGVIRLATWTFAPNIALTISNGPVPIHPPEVREGEKVFLDIDYCKSSSASGVSEVNLIGSAGAKVAINWPVDTNDEGCGELRGVPVPIPGQTPTDTYYVEFYTCYDINPLKKKRCTTFTSQSFKVVNVNVNPGDAQVQVE